MISHQKAISFALASLMIASEPAYALNISKTKKEKTNQEQQLIHPWKGKKVAFFGDSITDKHRVGTTKCYWDYLAEWLNITPLVYAVNGQQWNDIPRQGEQLKKEGKEVDAILILMGTNDYNAGLPIGEWWDTKTVAVEAATGVKKTEKRRHRELCMDESTFKGRINIGLSRLKHLYPDKQIVLLTPIHRAYAKFGETNIQPDENYPNSIGVYVDEYVEAIKEAGNIWAMPVIDLNSLSGLYPLEPEQNSYFHDKDKDLLHPSATGHERMAKTLMYQLLALPCTF